MDDESEINKNSNFSILIPSIEEVYDMDLDQLEFHLTKLNNQKSQIDEEDYEEIISFINHEIKERKTILDVCSFFTEISAEDYLNQIEEKILFSNHNLKNEDTVIDNIKANYKEHSNTDFIVNLKADTSFTDSRVNTMVNSETLPLIEIKRMLRQNKELPTRLIEKNSSPYYILNMSNLNNKHQNVKLNSTTSTFNFNTGSHKKSQDIFDTTLSKKKEIVTRGGNSGSYFSQLNQQIKKPLTADNSKIKKPELIEKRAKTSLGSPIKVELPSYGNGMKTKKKIKKLSKPIKEEIRDTSLDIRRKYVVPIPVPSIVPNIKEILNSSSEKIIQSNVKDTHSILIKDEEENGLVSFNNNSILQTEVPSANNIKIEETSLEILKETIFDLSINKESITQKNENNILKIENFNEKIGIDNIPNQQRNILVFFHNITFTLNDEKVSQKNSNIKVNNEQLIILNNQVKSDSNFDKKYNRTYKTLQEYMFEIETSNINSQIQQKSKLIEGEKSDETSIIENDEKSKDPITFRPESNLLFHYTNIDNTIFNIDETDQGVVNKLLNSSNVLEPEMSFNNDQLKNRIEFSNKTQTMFPKINNTSYIYNNKSINSNTNFYSSETGKINEKNNKSSNDLNKIIIKKQQETKNVNLIRGSKIMKNTTAGNLFLQRANPSKTTYNKSKPIKLINSNSSNSIFSNSINQFSNQAPMYKTMSNLIPNLPDYSIYFPNFQYLFNGFFLQSDYKNFDYIDTLKEILKSFDSVLKYENAQLVSEVDELTSTIVNAEADVIKNRLKKLSDKLLFDQSDLSDEKFYMYKKILELQKKDYYKKEKLNKHTKFFRVVLSRPEVYDIVSYILGVKPEWRELPHGMMLGNSWNIFWSYSYPKVDLNKILSVQKVNHLINNRYISRKDLLKKSIERVKKISQKCNTEFNIIPETYILGKEYMEFIESYSQNGSRKNPENIWIVKPNGKSRGRGIYLTNELTEVQPVDGFLVQKYITNPLLLENKYKFDLRIYVVVTSVNPLEAFLYKDGFARVSNFEYDKNNLSRMIHLTNAAIQNKESKKSKNIEKLYGGSKISLDILKVKLLKDGIEFDDLWKQIKTIVIKSLIATQYEMSYSPSTFELFGYDIMIDTDYKCWLIEVNMSPSLDRSNVLDDQVKLQLVDDILKILEIPTINRGGLVEVLNRRLQYESRNNMSQSQSTFIYSPITQLNVDMNAIFEGKFPRMFGVEPKELGQFEMISPSKESEYYLKISRLEKDKFGIKDKHKKN